MTPRFFSIGRTQGIVQFGLFRHLSGDAYEEKLRPLTRQKICAYLSEAHNLNKDQLVADLTSIGLIMKLKSPDERFIEFVDKNNKVRVKLHPADQVTPYEHMHIYNHKGKPLDVDLNVVSRKSGAAHIRIAGIKRGLRF